MAAESGRENTAVSERRMTGCEGVTLINAAGTG